MRKPLAAFIAFALAGAAWGQNFGPIPQVSLTTNVPTYSAATVGAANAGTGDLFCVYGSASKTIFINEVHVLAEATSAGYGSVAYIKRSSTDSGGTATPITPVPHDSRNPTVSASVTLYTSAPTPGTTVGQIRNHFILAGSGSTFGPEAEWEFGQASDQAIVLHGVNEGACVNIVASPGAGSQWSVYTRWTEQ